MPETEFRTNLKLILKLILLQQKTLNYFAGFQAFS